ncbi:MAG: HAMP domain-containing protein [Gammaproteobacteria bacterium]|nr:HAMP domain-containing protein [Gammaproteobacteria bacterium]
MQFHSFQTRLLVFVLGLLVLVQSSVFFAVNKANINNARVQIDEALEITAGVFKKSINDRTQRLLEKARLLSGDFAFKQAYATSEHGTILSALENHRIRIGSDWMMLISLTNNVIADTLHPDLHGVTFSLPELIKNVMESEYGETSSIEFVDGIPYQMVVVPLFTPDPSAWIIIGFVIDATFAAELQELTKSHVSIVSGRPGDSLSLVASTLANNLQTTLSNTLSAVSWEINKSIPLRMDSADYVSLVTPLWNDKDNSIIAVLQRSLDEAMQPYMRLQVILIVIFVSGLALSLVGGVLIARTVTRPVQILARHAHKIEEGDYTHYVAIKQKDELGELAESFNYMVKGLAERDRVRNLLGKVVSPAIAEELLSKEIKLGGEEREVTILFSDIRNFTTLSERQSPQRLLTLLNTYLTKIGEVVEANGGVVDKYIGDALMALFGAPLNHDDDATRAVNTAMGMHKTLGGLNVDFEQQGLPKLNIGIGINTSVVVVGNMGSNTRLNYTVIGDGVNLASRLEGLTKKYGVGVIVSESTKADTAGFLFRELDRVYVKGKTEAHTIFEPVAKEGELGHADLEALDRYHEALKQYREQNWDLARKHFLALQAKSPGDKIYQIYLGRIEKFIKAPPGSEWDGTFTHNEK